MSALVLLFSISVILTTCIIRWLLKLRKIRAKLSLLPGYNGNPILGSLHFLIGKPVSTAVRLNATILQVILSFSVLFRKEGLCKMWITYEPYVMLFSAETMEPILNSGALIEKSKDYNLLHCWLGTGLLTSGGNKWRQRRKLITPTFHYRILDDFIPIFNRHSKVFIRQIEKFCGEDWVDVVPLVTLYTLDIICETAMGIKLKAQEEKSCEYAEAIACVGDIVLERSVKPWLKNDTIFSLTSEGRVMKRALRVLHEFTSQVLKQRKEEMLNDKKIISSNEQGGEDIGRKKRRAFLDMLLQTQAENSYLSDKDICEEVDTFMFEGHDTTAMGISWALYHLGCHADIQEKVYQELQLIFGNDNKSEATSQDLKEMKYMDCVIKESQRLSPSVPVISRQCSEDVKIKDYHVPAGTTISLFIYGLHRDPNVYPNPEVFDPDRFLPDNFLGRHPFAFVPFSAGPRNCIGQKFAMNEMKISLCNIIRNFIVESVDPPDKILTSPLLVLRPENGLRMKFSRRL